MSTKTKKSTPKQSMDWQVVHIVNGERMTREELMTKYSKELERAAVKMMNIFAAPYGVEVQLRNDSK